MPVDRAHQVFFHQPRLGRVEGPSSERDATTLSKSAMRAADQ
jgi:hypothetical protein